MKFLVLFSVFFFTQYSYSIQCSELLLVLKEVPSFADANIQKAYEGDLVEINKLVSLQNVSPLLTYEMSSVSRSLFIDNISHTRLLNVIFMKHVESGNVEAVKALLASSLVDVNSVEYSTQNPIFTAVKSQSVEVVRSILAHPSFENINQRDVLGTGLLAYAVKQGGVEVVKELLTVDALKINQSMPSDVHPLSLAIKRNRKDIFDALLEDSRIEPSGLDGSETTPLIEALRNIQDEHYIAELAKFLKPSRLNIFIKTRSGLTASILMETKSERLIRLLPLPAR